MTRLLTRLRSLVRRIREADGNMTLDGDGLFPESKRYTRCLAASHWTYIRTPIFTYESTSKHALFDHLLRNEYIFMLYNKPRVEIHSGYICSCSMYHMSSFHI